MITGSAGLFPHPAALPDDHPVRLGQLEDLQALGLVFLELIFAALSESGSSDKTTDGSLQRLWLDVFKCNAREFKYDLGLPVLTSCPHRRVTQVSDQMLYGGTTTKTHHTWTCMHTLSGFAFSNLSLQFFVQFRLCSERYSCEIIGPLYCRKGQTCATRRNVFEALALPRGLLVLQKKSVMHRQENKTRCCCCARQGPSYGVAIGFSFLPVHVRLFLQ